MSKPFHVLIIDDSGKDALLIERTLRKEWPGLLAERVETGAALRRALEKQSWDCVLCDMVIPGFSADEALDSIKKIASDLPFIIVTGMVHIEDVISLLKNGAHDFVRKDDLARLIPAINKAIEEVKNLKRQYQTEIKLREIEANFRAFTNQSAEGISVADLDGNYTFVNPAFCNMVGWSEQELLQMTVFDVKAPSQDPSSFEKTKTEKEGKPFEVRLARKDGSEFLAEITGKVLSIQGRQSVLGTVRDITERKQHEAMVLLQARRAEALRELAGVTRTLSEEAFIQYGLRLAEDITGSNNSFFHFISKDKQDIELFTWSSSTLDQYCQVAHDTHYPLQQAGIWADALRQAKPVIFNDYPACEHKRGLPEGYSELKRLISLPIFENDQVVSLMGLGNKASDYTDADVESAQLIAAEISRIVQRRRLENRALRFSRVLERSLNEIYIFDSETLLFVETNLGAQSNIEYSMDELRGMTPVDIKPQFTLESFEEMLELRR